MTTREILFLVAGILVAIFGALTPLFRKLASKTETKIDDTVLELAISAVNYVQNNFLDSSNESKKQRAMDLVALNLAQKGIEKSKEVISDAVEMGVTQLKVAKTEKIAKENIGEEKK